MSIQSEKNRKKLEKLIIANVPRDALLALEDAYFSGDAKGRLRASDFESGHRPSAAGHNKHFYTNEAFFEALQMHGAEPTPLKGTRLVVGQLGIFNIARMNVHGHKWGKMRRSTTREQLALLNDFIGRKYVQSDLFATDVSLSEPTIGTIFIIGVVDGLDSNGISRLTQVMIALPSANLQSWDYVASMSEFVQLYDQLDAAVPQLDKAKPTLKSVVKKKQNNDPRN